MIGSIGTNRFNLIQNIRPDSVTEGMDMKKRCKGHFMLATLLVLAVMVGCLDGTEARAGEGGARKTSVWNGKEITIFQRYELVTCRGQDPGRTRCILHSHVAQRDG
jgi:hypothetical protein